jgi:GT2 family glycosyltransferase
MTSSLSVVVATTGRPQIVARLLDALARQTRAPDHVYVVGACEADISEVGVRANVTAFVGRRGSCTQRNDGLDAGAARSDVIVFLDDDFAPSRFWLERVERLFATRPEIVGVTGHVLADGAKTAGVAADEAWAMVEARDAAPPQETDAFEVDAEPFGYGCNSAYRGAVAGVLRFDERLPGYGWLEDRDYAARVRLAGLCGRWNALWGVHMGSKSGRTPGVRLGYSQIANSAYLVGKGTATRDFAVNLATRNILANLAKSLRPEPWIDRRGRLRGNLLALADLARGQVRPERAREL